MMRIAGSKIKQHAQRNPIERFLDSGLDQILGTTVSKERQKSQEELMIEGQEITLTKSQKETSQTNEWGEVTQAEPGIDYSRDIIHVAERAVLHDDRELEAQLREIMAEIKKLADSSKELQMQFKEVAVEQRTVRPGKYHKNFFSWLFSMVRTARMKVEDSGAWLAAMQSKKKSREYGTMAKKHGTTFSLSSERVVSTQVG